MTPALSHVHWKPSYRIIPSRFPPVSLFDRVADPADLEAVYLVQNLTNPRIRQEVGDLSLVPQEDRICGPGTTPIMAAFTHLNPDGSRFSDGSYGVFYAANDLDTAIAETRYHRERFMAATDQPAMELDMRVYLTDVEGDLHDIRSHEELADVYDPDDYSAGRALGRALKELNSWGIVYDSVRWRDGECVGIFRPAVLSNCRQGAHLAYRWNGEKIEAVYMLHAEF